MGELYSDKVMQHFSNPKNVGEFDKPTCQGKAGNPVCGDVLQLQLKIENDIIVDAKFKTLGCAAAIATSSMVTEMVKGKTIEDALKITNQAVTEALGGLPAVKRHCSVLAEEALGSAIDDYFNRLGKKNPFKK